MVSLSQFASEPSIPLSALATFEAAKLHSDIHDLAAGRGVFETLHPGKRAMYLSAIRLAARPWCQGIGAVEQRAADILFDRTRTDRGAVIQLVANRHRDICGPWHTAYRQAVKELCPTFGTKREALRELIRAGEYGFLCSTPQEREARQPKPKGWTRVETEDASNPFDAATEPPLYTWPGVNPPEAVRQEIEHVCACRDAEEAERFDGMS